MDGTDRPIRRTDQQPDGWTTYGKTDRTHTYRGRETDRRLDTRGRQTDIQPQTDRQDNTSRQTDAEPHAQTFNQLK